MRLKVWVLLAVVTATLAGCNRNSSRAKGELEIELNHRIMRSPFAAKRLSQLLQNLMKEYETRYGALSE
ncbi:MAG: DUF3467 domain-containing protein [Steroidobacteraceae bacterium]